MSIFKLRNKHKDEKVKKNKLRSLILVSIAILISSYQNNSLVLASPNNTTTPKFKMEYVNSNIYSVKKPIGWNLIDNGQYCGNLAVVIKNPKNPLEQVFYLSINLNRVVNPLLPEELLMNLDDIIRRNFGNISLSQLSNLKILKSDFVNAPGMLPFETNSFKSYYQTKNMNISFNDYGYFGEGEIGLSTRILSYKMPSFQMPSILMPYSFLNPMFYPKPYSQVNNFQSLQLFGITAPKGQLSNLRPDLIEILKSFKFKDEYTQQCKAIREQNLSTQTRIIDMNNNALNEIRNMTRTNH